MAPLKHVNICRLLLWPIVPFQFRPGLLTFSIHTYQVSSYLSSSMSASDEPKRATDLMSKTRASACGLHHRQSSFAKFIEALRLDEEIEDDEEEVHDYNDDVHALPPTSSTHISITKTTMATFAVQDRYDQQQHNTRINIKAPSAKDILRSINSETYHHTDSDVNVQDAETQRRMSTGKGRYFLNVNHLSNFIEKTAHGDLDREEREINAAIAAICSIGSNDSVSSDNKCTSKRQASFHDALVDIIFTEQAKTSQDGENAKKKSSKESSNRATFASDLRRRISDEIELRGPKRLSANMA